MNEDISKNLDPRQVLKFLNEFGVKNITVHELKEFMTDLKKLVRYDLLKSELDKENKEKVEQQKCEEAKKVSKLTYSAPTHSSKSKTNRPSSSVNSKKINDDKFVCKKVDVHIYKNNKRSNDNIIQSEAKKTLSRPSTSIGSNENVKFRKMKSSQNFIKTPLPEKPVKTDPVALYQYYSSMWQRFKPNLPGENDWSDLRWEIRTKLLGQQAAATNKENVQLSDEQLAKRRENWID